MAEKTATPSIQDDILSFHNEVLVNGADAVLPHNLTDGWLRRLIRSMEEREAPALAMMAVLALLGAKPNLRSEKTVSKDELAIYIERYYADLVSEELYRERGMLPKKNTIETILTNRMAAA